MSCYQIDKNLQYTKEKHSGTYSAYFFIDNTFFLSTWGAGRNQSTRRRNRDSHHQTVVS
jgi:hypothetical protein